MDFPVIYLILVTDRSDDMSMGWVVDFPWFRKYLVPWNVENNLIICKNLPSSCKVLKANFMCEAYAEGI